MLDQIDKKDLAERAKRMRAAVQAPQNIKLKALAITISDLTEDDEETWASLQASKKMTKDANYHSHSKKSSQHSSEDLTNNLANLTKGRNRQRPEHLMLLVFLRIKEVVNKLGSL